MRIRLSLAARFEGTVETVVTSRNAKLRYISAKFCLHPVGNGLASSACYGFDYSHRPRYRNKCIGISVNTQ